MMTADNVPQAALRWWQNLQPDPSRSRPQERAGDRAALARLRRCGLVTDAMHEQATMALFRAVGATHPHDLEAVALAASVLAHVREDKPGTVARLIGPDTLEKPETALLKPLRFRRLMEADTPDDRLLAFRRLVAIAGPALPVRDLAGALLDWTERRRTRWVLDYWNAAPFVPGTAPATQPSKDAVP